VSKAPEPIPQGAARLRDRWHHSSGGLLWHLRAWRRRARWAALDAALRRWLADWRPRADKLLLIGPSAGWTLPRESLARFTAIGVLEPDPLARRLLMRHLDRPLSFGTLDALAPGGFAHLATYRPDHALLFCNVLGQLAPAEEGDAWCAALRQALRDREWASWHDIASSARPIDRPDRQHFGAGTSFDAVMGAYWQGGRLEVTDHGSFALAGNEAFECVSWPLLPRQQHVLQWVAHTPGARA